MTTLAQVRQQIADALSAATGGTVHPKPPVHAAQQGDGWVTAPNLVPGNRFGAAYDIDVTTVIVAGPDVGAADTYLDDIGLALVDALTVADTSPAVPVHSVRVEPVQLTDSGGSLHVLLVSCTVELTE